jgi:hypothetical protein
VNKRNQNCSFFLLLFSSFFLCRFGNLSVHYPSLPSIVRSCLAEAIYDSKESGNEQCISNILLGLCNSQASWNDLEERACEGIVQRMRSTISKFTNQVPRLNLLVIAIIPFLFGCYFFHRILPIPCMLSPY